MTTGGARGAVGGQGRQMWVYSCLAALRGRRARAERLGAESGVMSSQKHSAEAKIAFWVDLSHILQLQHPSTEPRHRLRTLQNSWVFLWAGRWREIGGDCSHRETVTPPHVFKAKRPVIAENNIFRERP
jgi:hypothetical protein